MELLLNRAHAALQDCELGRGNRTGKDRPKRAEPDRLGSGTFGERGDLARRPVGSAGHPAKCAIPSAPAAGLGGGQDIGLAGPPVGRALRHLVIARPQGHASALRDRESELDLRLLAEFSRHGVGWHAATIGPAATIRLPTGKRSMRRPLDGAARPVGAAHGSQLGSHAGRLAPIMAEARAALGNLATSEPLHRSRLAAQTPQLVASTTWRIPPTLSIVIIYRNFTLSTRAGDLRPRIPVGTRCAHWT